MGKVRTRLKRISVAVAAVLLLVAGAGLYMVLWAYTAKPRATTDYLPRMKALVESGPATSEEAWRILDSFITSQNQLNESESAKLPPNTKIIPIDYNQIAFGDPEREELAPVREMLHLLEEKGVLAQVRSLAELAPARTPYDWANPFGGLEDTPLSNAALGGLGMRRWAWMLSWAKMRLSALEGDQEGFLTWFNVSLKNAESASATPTAIGGLISSTYFKALSKEMFVSLMKACSRPRQCARCHGC